MFPTDRMTTAATPSSGSPTGIPTGIPDAKEMKEVAR